MTFELTFIEGDAHEPAAIRGRIRLDGERDGFTAPLSLWDRDAYMVQWREAARRVLSGQPACFVVAIDEAEKPVGRRWMAWPQPGGTVLFQEWLILPTMAFDVSDPNASVPPAISLADDHGFEVSTWSVSEAALRDWLDRQT